MAFRQYARIVAAAASAATVLTASMFAFANVIEWNPNICNNTGVAVDGITAQFVPVDAGDGGIKVDQVYVCPPFLCRETLPEGGFEPYEELTGGHVLSNTSSALKLDYVDLGAGVAPGVCTHVGVVVETPDNCVVVTDTFWTSGGLDQGSQALPTVCFSGVSNDYLVTKSQVWSQPDGGTLLRTLYVASQASSVTFSNQFVGSAPDSGSSAAMAAAQALIGAPMYFSTSVTLSATDPTIGGLNPALPVAPQGAVMTLPINGSLTIDAGVIGGSDAGNTSGGGGPVPAMGPAGPWGSALLALLVVMIAVPALRKRLARQST